MFISVCFYVSEWVDEVRCTNRYKRPFIIRKGFSFLQSWKIGIHEAPSSLNCLGFCMVTYKSGQWLLKGSFCTQLHAQTLYLCLVVMLFFFHTCISKGSLNIWLLNANVCDMWHEWHQFNKKKYKNEIGILVHIYVTLSFSKN